MKVLFLVAFLTPFLAPASEFLSPEGYLRKLSLRVRGIDPSMEEYAQLSQLRLDQKCKGAPTEQIKCFNDGLKPWVDSFLKSPHHLAKMEDRLEELAYFRSADAPSDFVKEGQYNQFNSRESSFNFFVRSAIKDNRSWDHLYTGNEYDVKMAGSVSFSFGGNDLNYFSAFLPLEKRVASKDPFAITHRRVKVEDPRVAAGMISTPRFGGRFYNSSNNEGRKRAAAILRIGLCDSLFPAIERGDEHKAIEDKIARGMTLQEIVQNQGASASQHGQRKDCMVCHMTHGLDPLAWTFRNSELGLSLEPSSGRFVLPREGNSLDIPVEGLGSWMRLMVQQPEYAQCQTKHFWRWFVGDAARLSKKQIVALGRQFNELGRRPEEFIKYLVQTEEFWRKTTPVLPVTLYGTVKPILQHCDRCHAGERPEFLDLPIGGSRENMEYYSGLILDMLALRKKPYGASRAMPPKANPWQPTEKDLEAVVSWLKAGAPDEEDERHLDDSWVRTNLGDK